MNFFWNLQLNRSTYYHFWIVGGSECSLWMWISWIRDRAPNRLEGPTDSMDFPAELWMTLVGGDQWIASWCVTSWTGLSVTLLTDEVIYRSMVEWSGKTYSIIRMVSINRYSNLPRDNPSYWSRCSRKLEALLFQCTEHGIIIHSTRLAYFVPLVFAAARSNHCNVPPADWILPLGKFSMGEVCFPTPIMTCTGTNRQIEA